MSLDAMPDRDAIAVLVDDAEAAGLSLDADDRAGIERLRSDLDHWQREADTLGNCGMAASFADQPDLARRLYEAAIEGGDGRLGVYYNLGNALRRLGDEKAAVEAYGRAIEIDPEEDLPYCNRGFALLKLGRREEGVDNLVRAAELGCRFEPMYPLLCEQMILDLGHAAVLNLVLNGGLEPEFADLLFSELCERAEGRFYLLARPPEADPPEPEQYHMACLLADCLGDLGLVAGSVAEKVEALSNICDYAREIDDREFQWRAWYLLGAAAYQPIAISGFPRGLPMDTPLIFLPFAGGVGDEAADQAFAELAVREFPDVTFTPDDLRPDLAHLCFDQASSILANLPAKENQSTEFVWSIREDVFREAARCAVFRESPWDQLLTVERARRSYAGLRSRQFGRQGQAVLDRVFSEVSPADVWDSLGADELLLEYFTCEIVEDRLICAAISNRDGLVFEDSISTRSTETDVSGLLGQLLEANEHWIHYEERLAWLAKHRESAVALRAVALKLDNRQLPVDYPPEIEALLLGPACERLSEAGRLTIVPFNYIHNFPFHALPSVRQAIDLGNLQEILYLPSASARVMQQRRGPASAAPESALLVSYSAEGDIDHRDELEALQGNLRRVETLLGDEATCERVLDALGQFDLVHFCCHGRFDPDAGWASLDLADGRLGPAEVLDLDLARMQLVFANACVSGAIPRGALNGDQGIGLASALLAAGCRHVVGNLWDVRNDVAGAMATGFYEAWLGGGSAVPSAFLLAQSGLRQEYPRIDLWAPHVVFGAA